MKAQRSTIRITERAYRLLSKQTGKRDRSLCYLASEAICHYFAISGGEVMLTGHEPVAEFAAGLAAIRQHPMAAERFPEMDTKTLRALFGREINACYKITGNFALFFESIAKSPWLLANGKLDKLLQPSTYRAVCAGKYLPKGKSGNQVASDEDLLALDYQNELESLEDMEDFNE